ncbi:hypothetical protein GTQ99_18045 [Kineococcus sp. T13]|uniref:hypothetical protein n=1 Tax=Kineococcus vitellinus TaxID=2696565 RepID=UPI0014130ED3|nr:hypothetical protein [Kineococcus vitellinus]NAZ77309.1 hypothetical protein [Kineococcus vitellinus]
MLSIPPAGGSARRISGTRGAGRRGSAAGAAVLAAVLGGAGCSGGASDVAPPAPPAPAAAPAGAADAGAPTASASAVAAAAGTYDGDPAVVAVRAYLREQALAVNAGVADPAQLPAFTATLTPAAQQWALPLLAANLGDRMPGPYPLGVRTSTREGEDRVALQVCLQDRGWQVDRAGGQPVNAAHFATARAVVVRQGERWLVDDLVTDGGECSAADVVVERF